MQSPPALTAAAALALPLGQDQHLPRSLSYPCTKESRNPSKEETKEHCQMASSHQAGLMAWEECDCVPFVWLPPHSLAAHAPKLPTHIPRRYV